MNAFKLNKSDYKIIGGYLVIATLWLVFKFYVEKYTLVEYLIDIPVFWLQTIALLYVSNELINEFLIKKKSYVLLIFLTLLSFWFLGFLASLSGEMTRSGTIDWDEMPTIFEFIFININSSAANLGLPLAVISAKKYYEYQFQSIKLLNTQKELEIKVLKSQFNPHFLYNSLNTVDALVDYSSKEKIKEYISNLSSLYRYLITSKDQDVSTVEAELALAKNYFYLIETRFENDYQLIIKNNELNKNKYLPNGALLTALENVVKHNEPINGKTVIMTILIKEDQIKVTNTISKSSSKESLGTGLINLEQRYQFLSDKVIEIKHTEQEFVITLPLLTITD